MAPTYEQIRERLEEATDPERSLVEQIMGLEDQDEAMLAISEVRQGAHTLRQLIDRSDEDKPHLTIMEKRMRLAVAGADAAATALMDEYARSLHEIVNNCTCSYCMQARAHLN